MVSLGQQLEQKEDSAHEEIEALRAAAQAQAARHASEVAQLREQAAREAEAARRSMEAAVLAATQRARVEYESRAVLAVRRQERRIHTW